MFDLEQGFGTLSTRNIIYMREKMESLRIYNIFNIAGSPSKIKNEFIISYYSNCCINRRHGLIDLVDISDSLRKVSIIVFEDALSRNVYALANWEIFHDSFECFELIN